MLLAVVMIGLLLHRTPNADALEAEQRALPSIRSEMAADDSIPIVDWATGSDSSSSLAQNVDPQALADPVASSSGESSGSETTGSRASAQSSSSRSMEHSQSSGQSSSEGSDRSFAPRPSRTPARTPAPTHTPTPIPLRRNTTEPAPMAGESPVVQASSSSSSESRSPLTVYDPSPILTPTPAPVPTPAPATSESDGNTASSTTDSVCLASISVEGMQSNFCVYSVGKICSSTIKDGLCPGPQPGLEHGSYCDTIHSDSSNDSVGTVYGCKRTTTTPAAASMDTKAGAEGNHGRGRLGRRQY